MIIATRLSAVWQVAGVAAAALCCYLVSQSVATERASLEKVDRQIADTRDDIAKIEMEIGVRARMGQLESWNREVLALQAPRPAQFVASGIQLASLYGHRNQPALQLDPAIAGQQGSPNMASYQSRPPQAQPAAPAVAAPPAIVPDIAPAQPVLRAASFVRQAPDRLGGMAGLAPVAKPALQKASFEMVKALPAPAPDKPSEPAKVTRSGVAKSLLPDDIGLIAAREAKGTRDSGKAAR